MNTLHIDDVSWADGMLNERLKRHGGRRARDNFMMGSV